MTSLLEPTSPERDGTEQVATAPVDDLFTEDDMGPIVEPMMPKPSVASRAIVLGVVIVPFVAVLAAAYGIFGFSWLNLAMTATLIIVSGLGITAGYHRLFTHKSFVAKRPLKIALAFAGSLAFEGDVISWVANHRMHHRYSDREGDPHTPVRPNGTALERWNGFWHSHMGWLLGNGQTGAEQERYVPDLLKDRDLVVVSKWFPVIAIGGLVAPAIVAFAVVGTLGAAVSAFVWAGLVRVFVVHHVTWSINSVCHVFGKRPFRTNDASRNQPLLSVITMGEAWHNAHHAFPTMARHGVLKGQIDVTARAIWVWEKLGWATDVRWPREELLATRRQ